MTDPAAFLLLYQEPTSPPSGDVRASTMTKTFVDREEPDEDEDYGPVAGTKTITEVREETDDDETATRYGAVPRRYRGAALSGTQTMRRDGGGGTDQDPAAPTPRAIPIAGTQTVKDNTGATDTDDEQGARGVPMAHNRDAIRAGTSTCTKSTEEANDQDPTAPSFAAIPRTRSSR